MDGDESHFRDVNESLRPWPMQSNHGTLGLPADADLISELCPAFKHLPSRDDLRRDDAWYQDILIIDQSDRYPPQRSLSTPIELPVALPALL